MGIQIAEKLIVPFHSDIEVLIDWGSGFWKRYKYDVKSFDRIKNQMIKDDFMMIYLNEKPMQDIFTYNKNNQRVYQAVEKVFDIVILAQICLGKKNVFDRISIQQSIDFFGSEVSDMETEKWTEILIDLYKKYNGITGSLCINGVTSGSFLTTEWESFTGVSTDYERYIPGIYWCMILNGGQMDQLGGYQQVRESGLFYRTEYFSNNNGEQYYLQLTESLDKCTLTDLRLLYEFLKSKDALLPVRSDYFSIKKKNEERKKLGYSIRLIEEEIKQYEIYEE
jgi:hypothetical protein